MPAGRIVILALVATMLASCGAVQKLRPKKGLWFDGHQFRARAEKVEDVREDFAVTVHRASQSADGAREAGRHAAVTYCIEQFGRSEIDWAEGQGPDDEGFASRIEGDRVVLRGRCKGWS